MIALLLGLALTNMPPPPPETCPGKDAGTSCLTRRRTAGVCVQTVCAKTEFSKNGMKTAQAECMKCEEPALDGGTQ